MAMKVKPVSSIKPPIRIISGSLVEVFEPEKLKQIGEAVRNVLYGTKVISNQVRTERGILRLELNGRTERNLKTSSLASLRR